MEIFDLYDKDFNKLDKTMVRGTSNLKGEYHLVVHIWIKNSNNEYLVQQRNKTTDRIPYQWACTGGAASKGDTSIEAAIRETHEELGILIDESKFELVGRYYTEDSIANYIKDAYIIEADISLKDIKIDTVEVRDVAYMSLDKIKDMIKNKQFWTYDYLEDLEKR